MSDGAEKMKTVSVVMCTYNGARFLREQMDSILAQDYPLHEIIVQDDGSTDDTLDILNTYARQHPQIHVYRNEERLGFNRNFHTAMLRATGDFIAPADQDDIWFPQKTRRLVEEIGEADVCLGEYFTDAEYRHPLTSHVHPNCHFVHLLFYDCTPGHGMLVRTDFLKGIKHWDYFIYYDWWISFHAHLGRGFRCVREALNWHRHYDGSATTHIYKKGRWEAVPHPTWQPYVLGYFHRLHLQKKGNWQRLYSYLAEQTAGRKDLADEHRIACLMNKKGPIDTLRLCLLCLRKRDAVYPRKVAGFKGKLRAFFYPLISAYGNDLFKLEK